MRFIKVALLGSFLTGLIFAAAPPAHAQSPLTLTTKQRYMLPYSVVGCTARNFRTTREKDGSVSYGYSCSNPGGRSPGALVYTLNTNNASYASARDSSDGYQTAFTSPMEDGTTQVYTEHGAWGVVETGGDYDRITMGAPYHRVVIIVTVAGDPDNESWMVDYAAKVSKALLHRIP